MCLTIQSFGTTIVCLLQMVIRIIMTTLLMAENLIRLILQTIYNMLSFIFQLCSLIPICLVFVLTSKLKFLFCGGGGGCGGGGCSGQRGGSSCDCIISALAVILIIYLFKATGVLDKILNKLGYLPKEKKTFLRTNEEFEHLVRNGTDGYPLEGGNDLEAKQDPIKLELDYEDTTPALTTVAEASVTGNVSSTFPSNWTTVYYYLI